MLASIPEWHGYPFNSRSFFPSFFLLSLNHFKRIFSKVYRFCTPTAANIRSGLCDCPGLGGWFGLSPGVSLISATGVF